MTIEKVQTAISSSIETKKLVLNDEQLMKQILSLAERCTSALKNGGKIIFCGNGGSFADAQHLSAEFTSRFLFDRPGLPSLALGTNSSAMTAIGNDYGYENVFARELESISTSNDLLIAITTSGNSKNIVKALKSAKVNNLPSVVFTGESRGNIEEDIETFNIPSSDTARIQECHILIGHIICEIVEDNIFQDQKPK